MLQMNLIKKGQLVVPLSNDTKPMNNSTLPAVNLGNCVPDEFPVLVVSHTKNNKAGSLEIGRKLTAT